MFDELRNYLTDKYPEMLQMLEQLSASAMSMLTFYINRAGRRLPRVQRRRLEQAKDELRELFGRPRHKPG